MRCDQLLLSINFFLLLCDSFLLPQSEPQRFLLLHRMNRSRFFSHHSEDIGTIKTRLSMLPSSRATCIGIMSGLLAYNAALNPSLAQTLGSKLAISESVSCGNVQLDNLTKEGAGGGGTVFSATKRNSEDQKSDTGRKVVVKVSWATSANSVRHECDVLRYLEGYNVMGVERCIASSIYEPPSDSETATPPTDPIEIVNPAFFVQERSSSMDDSGVADEGAPLIIKRVPITEQILPKKPTTFLVSLYEEDETANKKIKVPKVIEKNVQEGQRSMIVLDPFFQTSKPSSSTLQDIPVRSVKIKAVHNLITTMIQMLSAGAAGSDLQPLINVETGETLLIDMTEAEIFSDRKELNFDDKQIAGSFIGEMFSLINSDKADSDILMQEARATIRQITGQLSAARDELPSSLMNIIKAYTE